MTANAIRTGLDTAGGVIQPGGGEGVYVEGYVIGVTGDSVAPHGLPPHDAAVMTGGRRSLRLTAYPSRLGTWIAPVAGTSLRATVS